MPGQITGWPPSPQSWCHGRSASPSTAPGVLMTTAKPSRQSSVGARPGGPSAASRRIRGSSASAAIAARRQRRVRHPTAHLGAVVAGRPPRPAVAGDGRRGEAVDLVDERVDLVRAEHAAEVDEAGLGELARVVLVEGERRPEVVRERHGVWVVDGPTVEQGAERRLPPDQVLEAAPRERRPGRRRGGRSRSGAPARSRTSSPRRARRRRPRPRRPARGRRCRAAARTSTRARRAAGTRAARRRRGRARRARRGRRRCAGAGRRCGTGRSRPART